MYHTRAHYLYPAGFLADRTTLAPAAETCHVSLCAGLCEREEMRPEPYLGVRAEELMDEKCNVVPQVGQRNILVDVQSFDLEELRRMRRVRCLVSVYPPGDIILRGGSFFSMNLT